MGFPGSGADVPELASGVFGLVRAFQGSQGGAGGVGLGAAELDVLRFVVGSPGAGSGVVARGLGLQSSNVSTTVRGLVGRGLIRREPDPSDRRSVRLQPTADALDVVARVDDWWTSLFADAMRDLDNEQRDALVAAGPALRALAGSFRSRRQA